MGAALLGDEVVWTPARPNRDRLLGGVQVIGFSVLLVAAIVGLCWACLVSPRFPFLSGEVPWITLGVDTSTVAVPPTHDGPQTTVFSRDFTIPAVGGAFTLSARAPGRLTLFLNGSPITIGSSFDWDWKRGLSVDVTPNVRPGKNSLRAEVANPIGPPLLSLELQGPGVRIVTDASWQVSTDASLSDAVLANDTRPHPDGRSVPGPWESLRARRVALLAAWLLGALISIGIRARFTSLAGRRLAVLVPVAITLAWALIWFRSVAPMPPYTGFDVDGHFDYILYLLDHHALPLPTDSWEAYQPPLFYLVTATFLFLTERVATPEMAVTLVRLISFLCGLGSVWCVFAAARLLFPTDEAKWAFATLFAGLVPMNLYCSAYISNEPMHAFWVGLAIALAIRLVLRPVTTAWSLMGVGAVFGLALLTKSTALLVVPPALLLLSGRRYFVDGSSGIRAAAAGAWAGAGALSVCGWYYATNVIRYGKLVVGNWDLFLGDQSWWQQPGFHTARYYWGFGEALRHPFFSGFHSFWDGIYSTFWGDALVAGRALVSQRHGFWNYDWMSAGYLVALPASAILGWGGLRALLMARSDRDPRVRLVLSFLLVLCAVTAGAVLAMTLRLPFYAQAKAFYGLCLMVPIGVLGGLGLSDVDERLSSRRFRFVRALYHGWLAALVLSVYGTFLG